MKRKRRYTDCTQPETFVGIKMIHQHYRWCEHCEGENSLQTRNDELRGWVCKVCDKILDEMFSE